MHIRKGLAGTMILVAMAATVLVPASAAVAAGPRPLFQLPFPCGETWQLQTYPGHDDYDIDMFATTGVTNGRTIVASYQGRVSFAGWNSGAGWYVKLNHGGGWETLYLHMIRRPVVSAGQSVSQGRYLGNVGSTGDSSAPHLHYEQRRDGAKVESWFNGSPSGITTDGYPPGEPQSRPVVLTSHNCGEPEPDPPYVQIAGPIDFDGDGRTDVFTVSGERWKYSSGGTSAWIDLGSSGVGLAGLRFGDFDGDGRTDVFTVSGERWKYSSGGTSAWINLGSSGVPLADLRIA